MSSDSDLRRDPILCSHFSSQSTDAVPGRSALVTYAQSARDDLIGHWRDRGWRGRDGDRNDARWRWEDP